MRELDVRAERHILLSRSGESDLDVERAQTDTIEMVERRGSDRSDQSLLFLVAGVVRE